MKINTLFLTGIILLTLSLPALAFSKTPICRGEVPFAKDSLADVTLPLPTLTEGGDMQLWHPITMDTEQVIRLTIQKIFVTQSGKVVFATYDNTNFSGFLFFKVNSDINGNITLNDFKGFEGESFGPAKLRCMVEN